MPTSARKAVSSFDSHRPTTTIIIILLAMAIMAVPAAQAQTLTALHNFTGGVDQGTPVGGLTFDQFGNLYGTTSGYPYGFGSVFEVTHTASGWILNTLYAFQGVDGEAPFAGVVFGPDGNLYGTTAGGGLGNGGTVFMLRPPGNACRPGSCSWTETTLYSFTGGADGGGPGYGNLAFDAAGNVYGTTSAGGDSGCNCGVVFKLSRSGGGWTENVIYTFEPGGGGYEAYGGVVLDSAGNVYGTTENGGPFLYGTLFQLTPSGSSWTQTVLHAFGPGDGNQPFAGPIMDQQGNLYGVTASGPGNYKGGAVYQLQRSGDNWTYSILADVIGDPEFMAEGPYAALTLDAAGNLYGTTYRGGSNEYGAVFKVARSGDNWIYTELHDFDYRDGAYPTGSVVLDAQGNLYSTTCCGGTTTYGEVWMITP